MTRSIAPSTRVIATITRVIATLTRVIATMARVSVASTPDAETLSRSIAPIPLLRAFFLHYLEFFIGDIMSTNSPQSEALSSLRRTIRPLVSCLCVLALAAPAIAADPILTYSSYLGGNWTEMLPATTVDAEGNVYITGATVSQDFPIFGSSLPFVGQAETFVTKLAPDGSLVYSTFLGIPGDDYASSIAVDPAGSVYVAGSRSSLDSPDAFAVKLSPAGNQIEYLKILESGGWPAWADATGIAVDPAGNAYVTGHSISPLFPVERPIGRLAPGSGSAAYVVKLDPSGGLVYGTYLGGSSVNTPTAVAVDAAGHAYVTGSTDSYDYPAVFADGSPYWSDVPMSIFVVKLDPAGTSPLYTLILEGGNQYDSGDGIAVDDAGQAYVLAEAWSSDLPTINAFQTTLRGVTDAYVLKLSATGSIVYATYLGGGDVERPGGIAIDSLGSAYVTGATASFDFPLRDPVQASCADSLYCRDAFVAKLSPDGSELIYSTYLGGSSWESGTGIAIAPGSHAWITGMTASADFPTVNPFQPTFGGDVDTFVSRISTPTTSLPDCSRATASPSTVWPPNGKLVPVAILGVAPPAGDPLNIRMNIRVTEITQDEPATSSASAGIGTSTPRIKAERNGQGDGRVYHILFEASALSGASCTGEVTVCVPHDQGKGGSVCVDSLARK